MKYAYFIILSTLLTIASPVAARYNSSYISPVGSKNVQGYKRTKFVPQYDPRRTYQRTDLYYGNTSRTNRIPIITFFQSRSVHKSSNGYNIYNAYSNFNYYTPNVSARIATVSGRGGTPGVPNLLDNPQSPGVPDVPDNPFGPGVPDVPDNPYGPGVPDVPNNPFGPGVPDVPNNPFGPGVPDVPGNPYGPGVPDVPNNPYGPGVPDVPDNPFGPGVPDVPTPLTNSWDVTLLLVILALTNAWYIYRKRKKSQIV